MPVVIAPQYTQRILQWSDWKAEQVKRNGIFQVVEDPDMYTIWFYDTPDAFITFIHKGTIPDTDIALGRTQGDNDAAKTEFEADFLSIANETLNRKASSNHVAGGRRSQRAWRLLAKSIEHSISTSIRRAGFSLRRWRGFTRIKRSSAYR